MITRFVVRVIFVYLIIVIVRGSLDYNVARQNFYSVDRHFSVHFGYTTEYLPKSIKGAWCAIIAEDDFLKKSTKERRKYAEQFFDTEIAKTAGGQGYDVKELRDWFIRYAALDVESMPVKEFILDRKGENAILYRDIDLSKKPNRNITYFFSSPDLYKDSFWILIVVGIPVILIFYAIRRFLF